MPSNIQGDAGRRLHRHRNMFGSYKNDNDMATAGGAGIDKYRALTVADRASAERDGASPSIATPSGNRKGGIVSPLRSESRNKHDARIEVIAEERRVPRLCRTARFPRLASAWPTSTTLRPMATDRPPRRHAAYDPDAGDIGTMLRNRSSYWPAGLRAPSSRQAAMPALPNHRPAATMAAFAPLLWSSVALVTD